MKDLIRKAKVKDAKGIATVVATAWQETYRGIVNDEYLDNLTNEIPNMIERYIKKIKEGIDLFSVLEVDGKIVGFTSYGKAKNEEKYPSYGEIYALYIIDGYKGFGFGKKLVINAAKELIKLGYKEMVIGCLVGNPSNSFYKHLGGIMKDKAIFKRAGQNLDENYYYYDDIKLLVKK